jgi:putative polyhydroxyalkanoate system protein
MSTIHIRHPHRLSDEEARKRVEAIARDLKQQLSMDYAWRGERLVFKRSGAAGSIDLPPGEVDVKIELGMLLTPMKGKIEQTVRERIDLALADDKRQNPA